MSERTASLDKVQEAVREAIQEAHTEAVKAFRELAAWKPEDEEDWKRELKRLGKAWYGQDVYEEGDETMPFFSEAFLYLLLGKEDARSLLGRLDRLGEALGLSDKELP